MSDSVLEIDQRDAVRVLRLNRPERKNARAGTSPDGGLSWTLPQTIGHEAVIAIMEKRKPEFRGR